MWQGYGKNCSIFNHFHGNVGKIEFDIWKLEDCVLVDSITRLVCHMVSNGLFKYQSIGHHDAIIAGVQISAEWGITLVEYDLITMTLDTVVRVSQQKFLSIKCLKFLLAACTLLRYINESNRWGVDLKMCMIKWWQYIKIYLSENKCYFFRLIPCFKSLCHFMLIYKSYPPPFLLAAVKLLLYAPLPHAKRSFLPDGYKVTKFLSLLTHKDQLVK